MRPSEIQTGDYVRVILEGVADTRLNGGLGGFWLGTGAGNRALLTDANGAIQSIDKITPPAVDPLVGTFALVTVKQGVDTSTIPLFQKPGYIGKTQVLLKVVLDETGKKVVQDVLYRQQFQIATVLQFADVTTTWIPQV